MTTEPLDLMTIDVSAQEELSAQEADLFVTISGASLFTGQEALKKAREVASLVTDLKEAGVNEDDIRLEGVQAQTQTGTLVKSSTAIYRLRVRCRTLTRLGDVLGAITAQKNAHLSALRWRYPDEDAAALARLCRLTEQAKAKATALAQTLGVRLLGVHRLSETVSDPEQPQVMTRSAPGELDMARRSHVSSDELGLEVSHTKTITTRLSIQFRLSEMIESMSE